jgi:tetratricopeptide (TPR) repeat protein
LITLVLANTYMSGCQHENCEFEKAFSCWKKSLEINVAANVLWGISVMKAIVSFYYVSQGQINPAYEISDEAIRIADESGDIYSKAHAYTAHGWSAYHKGYIEEAKKHLIKGADFCERINMLVFAAAAHSGLGMTYLNMEEYRTSQKHFGKAISINRQGSLYPSYFNCYKIAFSLAKVMNDERDIKIDEIFRCYDDCKLKLVKGVSLYFIGKILLNIDDQHFSEAEDWIKKAVEMNQKYGMRWNLARDYALYADLFKRKEDFLKVKEKLNTAIEIFKECGADGWVERYEKELITLS